ncbi:hypothetical protein [Pseudovibrio sp. Tun.PSC04-5.I4]|uniref:hypothetical protein n=1 Tax=Pseudovibrio sp. Tun.PSC04-5.I4 TaxID=1798213 RepID=UPI00088E4F1D|nr:hypothetical protein [Pseudovibrio sp. Tun.PSC04-5.I4]SDQ29691.1 hypothetical protein SAMN04515695_0760 [Pseudovibrio sp. Tun.PSC04-5.I4]
MKKIFVIIAATMMLAACQTTSVVVSSKQPPRVVMQKPLPAAKKAVIEEFKSRGFKVTRSAALRLSWSRSSPQTVMSENSTRPTVMEFLVPELFCGSAMSMAGPRSQVPTT